MWKISFIIFVIGLAVIGYMYDDVWDEPWGQAEENMEKAGNALVDAFNALKVELQQVKAERDKLRKDYNDLVDLVDAELWDDAERNPYPLNKRDLILPKLEKGDEE
jgi:hypothetical protein